MSGELHELELLMKWRDFYSMSECRDLCFHVQEHRFSVAQLKTLLHTHNLRFLGFLLPELIKSQYQKKYTHDLKLTDLDHWAEFEEEHPDTFECMYQFWVTEEHSVWTRIPQSKRYMMTRRSPNSEMYLKAKFQSDTEDRGNVYLQRADNLMHRDHRQIK